MWVAGVITTEPKEDIEMKTPSMSKQKISTAICSFYLCVVVNIKYLKNLST